MLRTNFTDSEHWLELAQRHLTSYDLPKWSEECSTDKMELWLARFDLDEKDYLKLTNTTLAEFRKLNPDWPLRAFVGLLLEVCDERNGNGKDRGIR